MVNKKDFYIDIKNRAKNIYEQYQYLVLKSLKTNTSNYSLEFNIKEDSSLGGKAWFKDNLDNIQINKGVIDNYFDYFYGFTKMQTADFLDKLHIEDMEESSYEFIKFDKHGNPNYFDSKVIDYKLAGLLTIFVSRFIITHELGHLFNGHCEYLNSKDQNDMQHIQMFEKDNSKNIKNVSSLDFRTLEMDADAFAATDNFRNLLLIYGKFEDMVEKDLNIEPIELFYWWSFAIRSNFLITQKILNDEEYSTDKKHLPSVARWVLILGTILNIIDGGVYNIHYRTGDNKEKLLAYIVKGFLFAENQYNERFYTKYSCLEETMNSKDYNNYVTETQNNWEHLRNDLSKYSRLTLYKSNKF
ncbi:hypothetical protein ACE1TH_06765 [Shouchella sp. JSM 1781072]|uniref:hypothetical protein n=1 Tax=Shouchella sp. JSM 1781072 TaxID=3344581 RepID=UPI0035BF1F7B